MVSVQRLKPVITSDEEKPASPPCCGRPPCRVPPDPPHPVPAHPHRRPWKTAASASTVIFPRRKRVIFRLTPVIIGD